MHLAEGAGGEERAKRTDECAAAIMKLWAHRNVLPDGTRPFESLEPVIRTLQSLDPDAKKSRFFLLSHNPEPPANETPSGMWLNRAENTDETARRLVQHCLTKAADLAIEGSEEWLTLGKSVMSDRDEDLRVIIRLFSESETSEAEKLRIEFRSEIDRQIAGLRSVIELAQSMIDELDSSAPEK